ncbi:MAG: ZIP family metal transporter [Tannerella sp.]|jgi:ZIP family zinc transporter|nr:ZIP family metal transporter [Tannerella sp.]
MNIAIGLLLPFLGTLLGSAMVFLLKDRIAPGLQKLMLGFASGIMVAASVWSLLIPSIEMAEQQARHAAWIPAATGFLAGMFFLLLLDSVIPHLHLDSDKPEGMKSNFKKTTMLVFAVTLHNIPEGMAVGVVLAGLTANYADITLANAMALSIGIAIQNFPEGAIVSMPLKSAGKSRLKAFTAGALSGAVEPVAGIITVLLIGIMLPVLPFLLAFAAGAMMYVVVEELVPELQSGNHSNIGTIGVAMGFTLMMILDVALG